MFCFCFQSPSLKLQALEADLEASLDPQSEDAPAAQHQPLAAVEKSLLLHPPPSPPAEDQHISDPAQPGPLSSAFSSVHSPAASSDGISGSDAPPSPPGPPTSPLLSRFTMMDNPIPSPRCPSLSHSLRYNLDPDSAPSPPCSQHIHMARSSVHAGPGEGSVSISVLNRHVHSLRKRIRQFEEHFEQEKHYKPAHNDKTAHPEVSGLMTELIKSRKKLKELKLIEWGLRPSGVKHRTSTEQRETAPPEPEPELQHVNEGNAKPSMEDTVNLINSRLKERRRELGLPEAIKDMSHVQMNMEKTSLQKCLLHFESLHGRPSPRQEWILVQPFYERYRLLKHLLLSSAATVITTIEEEEGSDEECTKQPPPGLQSPRCLFPDESADLQPPAPLVSPLEEEKTLQPQSATVATLHEASRSELLDHFRTTRLEKRRLNRVLREFEAQFCVQTGRTCQKEDRGPMAEEYCQYKNLKAKLRLLEALLSKRKDSTKSS